MTAVCWMVLNALVLPPYDYPREELSDGDLQIRAIYPFLVAAHGQDSLDKEAFAESAADYEELCRRGYNDPHSFQRQGVAYFLSGDAPRAILAYRRGLRLAPNHAALQAALTQARDQVGAAGPDAFARAPSVHWPTWYPYVPPGFAWLLAEIGYAMAWISFTGWLILRRARVHFFTVGVMLIMLLFGAQALVAEAALRLDEQQPIVVIAAEGALLHTGNGPSYPAYPDPLPRGAEARLLYQRKDWLQIELAGGEVGWVPRAAALVDEP